MRTRYLPLCGLGAGSSPLLKAQRGSLQARRQEGSLELEPRAPTPSAASVLSVPGRFCVRVYSRPPWPSSQDSWEPLQAWPSLAWKAAPVWEQECSGWEEEGRGQLVKKAKQAGDYDP